MTVRVVSSMAEWKQLQADTGKIYVVDFSAEWCGPCKMIKPQFEKLSNDVPALVFLSVDVDECSDVAEHAHISAMPTFQVWQADSIVKHGEQKLEVVGANPHKLEDLVSKARSLVA